MRGHSLSEIFCSAILDLTNNLFSGGLCAARDKSRPYNNPIPWGATGMARLRRGSGRDHAPTPTAGRPRIDAMHPPNARTNVATRLRVRAWRRHALPTRRPGITSRRDFTPKFQIDPTIATGSPNRRPRGSMPSPPDPPIAARVRSEIAEHPGRCPGLQVRVRLQRVYRGASCGGLFAAARV
jgi:hypothetical protein